MAAILMTSRSNMVPPTITTVDLEHGREGRPARKTHSWGFVAMCVVSMLIGYVANAQSECSPRYISWGSKPEALVSSLKIEPVKVQKIELDPDSNGVTFVAWSDNIGAGSFNIAQFANGCYFADSRVQRFRTQAEADRVFSDLLSRATGTVGPPTFTDAAGKYKTEARFIVECDGSPVIVLLSLSKEREVSIHKVWGGVSGKDHSD